MNGNRIFMRSLSLNGHLPRPPAPTISTLAFLSLIWPLTPTSGKIICRLNRLISKLLREFSFGAFLFSVDLRSVSNSCLFASNVALSCSISLSRAWILPIVEVILQNEIEYFDLLFRCLLFFVLIFQVCQMLFSMQMGTFNANTIWQFTLYSGEQKNTEV